MAPPSKRKVPTTVFNQQERYNKVSISEDTKQQEEMEVDPKPSNTMVNKTDNIGISDNKSTPSATATPPLDDPDTPPTNPSVPPPHDTTTPAEESKTKHTPLSTAATDGSPKSSTMKIEAQRSSQRLIFNSSWTGFLLN
jgi:hypothetical protein